VNKNKALKVLATSALLASVAAPFGAGVVSANSTNTIKSIINVESDYNNDGAKSTSLTDLEIKQDDTDITSKDTFRIVLPSGVEWDDEVGIPTNFTNAKVSKISDQVLEVTPNFNGTLDGTTGKKIIIPLYVKFDGAEAGEQKLKIEALDSTITSGSYTFAVVGTGSTNAVVDDVKSVGKGKVEGGTIRIDETAVGAVDFGSSRTSDQTFRVKLSPNFEWSSDMEYDSASPTPGYDKVTSGGGFGTSAIKKVEIEDDNRTLKVTVNPNGGGDAAKRGSIYIKPTFKANSDAQFQDVTVNISGAEFTDQDVVIAKYTDFGGTFKVDKVNELIAGKVDDVDTKTGKITIEEAVAGSFISNRDLTMELPGWVKVVGITETSKTNFSSVDFDIKKGSENKVIITPQVGSTLTSSKGKIEFKLQLSIQGNKTGDIEATLKGSGIEDQKVVIAKAKAPVTVESVEPAKVKIGAQDQDAPDFVITETGKGAIEKTTEKFNKDDITYSPAVSGKNYGPVDITTTSGRGEIRLTLPTGVSFSSVPKVEVIDGDLQLDTDSITRAENNTVLVIPVKSESTKASKIKVSGVKLTVDRTVPEGAIDVKVKGSAVVENADDTSKSGLEAGRFNQSDAVKATIATTVTPAPTDTTASNIVFKLNSKTYTVDGKELEMDAAPLVGWDRAYLPVRFAANALNVSDDQIIWDDKTSTFTVFKGDRVVSGKVGDKFLTVNGAKVPMDVPVWRNKAQTNNRVMVPIRYLANALNANIEWNKETSEITIQAAK